MTRMVCDIKRDIIHLACTNIICISKSIHKVTINGMIFIYFLE
uniref:Uncharacterized protein n=1 Tax=Lepeophtheirus salmonis TaxID=72036 RepID=A0A0K2VBP5_LEPSM